jgi:hypothetical protein
MKFALVRIGGIQNTDQVNAAVASMGRDDDRNVIEVAMDAVSAYIAASEGPTDAELDELCGMMWPHAWHWKSKYDGMGSLAAERRNRDRARMRAFLSHLSATGARK